MSFLFKNKAVKTGLPGPEDNNPLPGFLKTEPSFNMDYPIPDREDLLKDQPHFTKPLHHGAPQYSPVYTEKRKGALTIHFSHSGVLGILFALLLLGVLFFMAGFLSGMMTTEYAAQSQNTPISKKSTQTIIDSQGDDNV
jgi:hypothetical protein